MIGVITAVNAERDAVLSKMRDVREYHIYGIEFYKGLIGNAPCITAMSGVGKVNAARCTQLMIDRFLPPRIVNVGSAGALHPEIKIGDVIISTSCIQHDLDLTAFGLRKGFWGETDGFIPADVGLVALCKEAMRRSSGAEFNIFSGPIATGDQFNDSVEQKERLYREFGAYCIEMEGAAIAQVCAMCNIPFVIIRSISDSPSEDTSSLYENFKTLAAERCATFLSHLVEYL
jgi:adenosylhomocysteine nucleosidase